MSLVQVMSVSYAFILGRMHEFGSFGLLVSLTIILIVGLFGFIPGIIFHAIKNKFTQIPSYILGVVIFILINSVGYISGDSNEPVYDMIYSFLIYGLAGIFYARLYSKFTSKEST